jgi:hypothetical protein
MLALGLSLGSASLARGQTPAPAPAPQPGEVPPPAEGTMEPMPAEPPPPDPMPMPAASDGLSPKQVDEVRKEIAAAPKMYELHGYLRSGIGINSKGGDQEAFQAPGAYSK